jgi:8-oxo-dGTP pyrophosphatase MutT (NUDIX family)
MRIVGVPHGGGPRVIEREIGHGEDPAAVLRRHGYAIRRLLSVTGVLPDIVVTAQVSRRPDWAALWPRRLRRPAASGLEPGPSRRQRLAAYVIALSERGLLATQFSDLTAVAGLWGLPGGGIDSGETAAEAAIREVAEESGQQVVLDRILDIQSDHWVGLSPVGRMEDFHAVRLIYVATVPEPTDPVVRDVGGTTAAARWVPVDGWRRVSWSGAFRAILMRHLDRVVEQRRTAEG